MKSKKINYRHIAELAWGNGGTISYRTNRKKTYYYSCSGHGGYVVPAEALSEEERANIEQHTKPVNVKTLEKDGIVYGVYYGEVPTSWTGRGSQRNFRCAPGSVWKDNPVYLFEEDCEWAVLEKFTDVRRKKDLEREDRHVREEAIEKTMERWFYGKEIA